jgi:hypothetical protein
LYKDGNSVATVDISGSSAVNLDNSGTAVGYLGGVAGYGVTGVFYRWRTWKKLLSAAEVVACYENASVPIVDQWTNCVTDLDMAFANPERSLSVRSRSGAGDATASVGIFQVTPIEQLNAKAARIGTSAATPADGELLVSGNVGIGITPTAKLQVLAAGTSAGALETVAWLGKNSTSKGSAVIRVHDTVVDYGVNASAGAGNFSTTISSLAAGNPVEGLRIDSAGNAEFSKAVTINPNAALTDATLKIHNNNNAHIDFLSGNSGGGHSGSNIGNTLLDFRNNHDFLIGASDDIYLTNRANYLTIDGSTGLTTVYNPGWPLKNELTNSGFDVWSNSTLEDVGSDLVTNGDFASASDWTISVASGTWAITGGVSRATAAAGAAQFYQARTYTVGKLYKVTWTVSGYSAGGIYIELSATTSQTVSANGTYSFVFEAADASDYINFRTSGTTTLDIDNVTLYEVTPGIVSASSVGAMDGWERTNLVTVKDYREHDGSNTKDGSFYALKVVNTRTAGGSNFWPEANGADVGNSISRFAGRTVTFGAWMKQDTANEVNLAIADSDGTSSSSTTATTGSFVWHEVTRAVDAGITTFKVYLQTAGGAASTESYFSQPMLVFGSAIGSGNYSRPMGEIVWCEKEISSNVFDGSAFSDVAAITLNAEADSNGKIPKGAKAVYMQGWAKDSGSAGTDCYFHTRQSATSGWMGSLSPAGLTNDMYARVQIEQPCNSDGDFDYIIEASGAPGAATFDTSIGYRGVQLR